MNIAIYLRKSRSDPEDESMEETLSRHKKTLLKFAKTNSLTILKIYEEVVSGDGLFVRPEMVKLMSDIEEDKYDGVLCMDIDRLGRVDTKDRGIILDTFKSHNTKIITPRKIYNLNDELDEFSTEIQMLFARQELKKITQRLKQGVRRTLEDGYHVGEPPYGYRRIYVDKRPTLQIHEEEAEVVRKIFDMYVNQHIGSYLIAEHLNLMGYKTRANKPFSRNSIRFLLQNPTYIGKIVWNKRQHIKKKSPTDKHRSKLNPQAEWIVSDGVHQPIIDVDTFNKAQKIRTTRSHPPSFNGTIKNPFAGIIRCANCGQLMSRQTSKKTGPRLLCVNNNCNKSVTIDKVEAAVYEQLKAYLHEFNLKVESEPKPNIEPIKKDISSIKKQISTLNKQKDSLHDLLEQGVYTIDTFLKRGEILTNNIEQLQKTLKEKELQLEKTNKSVLAEKIIPTLTELVTNYDTMLPNEKNLLMKEIIEAIYYRREKISNQNAFDVRIVFKQWI